MLVEKIKQQLVNVAVKSTPAVDDDGERAAIIPSTVKEEADGELAYTVETPIICAMHDDEE